MSRYIGQYVGTCDLCLRTKPIRQAPVGELHPLRILDSRWDTLKGAKEMLTVTSK